MAYKVLNNVSVKDVTSSDLLSLKTDLLVIVINKNTKDKVVNQLAKDVSSHLKESGSSVLVPNAKSFNAKNVLLVKGFQDSDQIHKLISMYQSIAQKGNQLKAKDISIID